MQVNNRWYIKGCKWSIEYEGIKIWSIQLYIREIRLRHLKVIGSCLERKIGLEIVPDGQVDSDLLGILMGIINHTVCLNLAKLVWGEVTSHQIIEKDISFSLARKLILSVLEVSCLVWFQRVELYPLVWSLNEAVRTVK